MWSTTQLHAFTCGKSLPVPMSSSLGKLSSQDHEVGSVFTWSKEQDLVGLAKMATVVATLFEHHAIKQLI